MGGASAQIAIAVDPSLHDEKELKKIKIRFFGGRETEYYLFVTTFLGFGANQAMERYHEYLLDGGNFEDPCLPKNFELKFKGHTLSGASSFEECYKKITPILRVFLFNVET